MRTIDDVLNDAAEGLKAEGARTMSDRDPVATQRLTLKPLVVMPVVALIVFAVIGIPAILLSPEPGAPTGAGTGETSESVSTPTATSDPSDSTVTTITGPDDPANGGPTLLLVSTLSTSDPQVPDWPHNPQDADRTLAATGVAYDEYPDYISEAAVKDARAVIVGGNAERIAGIWFSDDGTWTEATINLPSWINIGESEGDYRLADGIQNVEAFSGGFVAWEPLQVVKNDEPELVGTLVLVSTDGAEWEANIYGEPNAAFTDFGEYADGYLATLSLLENGRYTSKLLWTSDLWSDNPIDWNSVGTIGDGFAQELAVEGSAVYVLLGDLESDDNGGVNADVARVDLG